MKYVTFLTLVCVFLVRRSEGGGAFGNACAEDVQCSEQGSKCVNNQCGCDEATGYTPQGSVCKMKTGTTCTATADCIDKAECTGTDGSKTCSCMADYTAKTDNTMCQANIDTVCLVAGDCLAMYAGCTGAVGSKTCTCNPGYTAKADKLMCEQKVGSSCTDNANCLTYGECTGTVGSKTCTCKGGYKASTNNLKCDKENGVGTIVASLSVLLMGLFLSMSL